MRGRFALPLFPRAAPGLPGVTEGVCSAFCCALEQTFLALFGENAGAALVFSHTAQGRGTRPAREVLPRGARSSQKALFLRETTAGGEASFAGAAAQRTLRSPPPRPGRAAVGGGCAASAPEGCVTSAPEGSASSPTGGGGIILLGKYKWKKVVYNRRKRRERRGGQRPRGCAVQEGAGL